MGSRAAGPAGRLALRAGWSGFRQHGVPLGALARPAWAVLASREGAGVGLERRLEGLDSSRKNRAGSRRMGVGRIWPESGTRWGGWAGKTRQGGDDMTRNEDPGMRVGSETKTRDGESDLKWRPGMEGWERKRNRRWRI